MPKHVAGRQKKVLKRAKSKHAEARGKKKHAGRTAASRASRRRLNQSKRATQCHLSHASHAKRPWMCNCACHVKSRWMSPSATPATQKWRRHGRHGGAETSPSAPPSAICPTQATQNDGRCEVVPRLPREIKVDVTKCHACHAEVARRHRRHGGA